jgi:hypothetical protein
MRRTRGERRASSGPAPSRRRNRNDLHGTPCIQSQDLICFEFQVPGAKHWPARRLCLTVMTSPCGAARHRCQLRPTRFIECIPLCGTCTREYCMPGKIIQQVLRMSSMFGKWRCGTLETAQHVTHPSRTKVPILTVGRHVERRTTTLY